MHRLHSRSGQGPRLALAVAIAGCLLAVGAAAARAAPFAYVTTGYPANDIAQFNIGPGGLLAPLSPPTVAAVETAAGIAVTPDGRSVYVTDHGGEEGVEGDAVSQYDVRPNGTLSPKSPFELPAGDGPIAVAVDPDGQSVYVANEKGESVSQYDVAAGGRLLPKSPATVIVSTRDLNDIEVSPDGNSVYAVDEIGVVQLDVGPGGALSPKSPPAVAAGRFPADLAIAPDGNSAYVVICCSGGSNGSISQYEIDSRGRLSPTSLPTAAAGASPSQVAVNPDGKSAYVIGFGSGDARDYVLQYDIGPNGALTPKSPFRVTRGADSPWDIVVSPDGNSVYVANGGDYPQQGNISQYDVGARGQLSPKSPPTVDVDPGRIALGPPVPTTKDQCGHGGWREFGFESKRQCIRFVKRAARDDCRAERDEIGRQAFRKKYGRGKHHRRAMHRCIKQAIGAP
jgi:DNA-binding beta-propeller fold protein YncE